jgi:hypothetical protein
VAHPAPAGRGLPQLTGTVEHARRSSTRATSATSYEPSVIFADEGDLPLSSPQCKVNISRFAIDELNDRLLLGRIG